MEKRMDLLPLRYFQVVARREHISRAAEELHVAQPSVSRAIARLEAELGVPLFDRRGRQVRLNRFGVMLLRRVDRALGELDDARRELADATELDHGSVAVSSETLLTLSELLAGFYAAHPGVEVQLYQASAETMTRQLRAREVDLCVASQPLTGPALGSVHLVREEVLLAVPPHHPLAARDRVTVAALADEPFVTTRPGHWMRILLDRLFADAGLTPRITCEGDEPAATLQLIKVGLGIGLMPAMGHQAATDISVPWLHLDAPNCYRSLTLVWREDAYLSTTAQRFRTFATEHFRTPGHEDARAR
jgi:DNA-binding transcriptional LysR family regulator